MSTQRPNDNQIIASGTPNSTVRSDEAVIASASGTMQIVSSSMAGEVVLNGIKYNIEKLIARSGEAEIFLVSHSGNHSVFKYYYSQYKPKDEILTKLKGLQHADIISMIDYGYYHDRFFEISEYAQGGTLQDIMPVTSVGKIKEIVAETIEALNYCHTNGIIHRDIKPENIFYRTSDKKDIAIGDFGIASNVKEGEELVRTSLARTSVYAAPELFTNIQGKTTIEKSVDYYALGITLLHLWFGRNPFEDVDEFGIMRLKSEGRVLFPDNMDKQVETLIKGLITVIPNNRWSYDEVKRWLNGEEVKVHYQTIRFDYKPYSFGMIEGEQVVVNDPKELVYYLEKYPEKGEGHLYRNSIAKWIESVDSGLFNDLMDIVEKDFPRDRTAGLAKAIYILDIERPFRGINNAQLKTQEEIAAHFEQNFAHYEKDLQNPNATFYIFLEARNQKEKAKEYKDYFAQYNTELALNTLILGLQGSDKLMIDNYTIYQPEELLNLDSGTKTKIINRLSNVNSKLSLWISSIEHLQPTIDKWRVLKRFDETTLRYALQQGFEFGSSTANNTAEFHFLFKKHLTSFFSDTDTSKNQSEADYWLTNYCNSSLAQSVVAYIQSESSPDSEFVLMLRYILNNYEKTGKNIYQVIEILLPKVKEKTSGNSQLLNNIIDIHRTNIENFWTQDYQLQSVRLIDCINNYISFVEKNITNYHDFLAGLTLSLDNRINTDIHKDIDRIKGDESRLNSYRQDIQVLVDKLGKINAEQPYIRHYNQELALISHQSQIFAQKNAVEKNDKINFLSKEYDDILAKKKADAKKNYKVGLTAEKMAVSTSIVACVIGIILLAIDIASRYESLGIIGAIIEGGVIGILTLIFLGFIGLLTGRIIYIFIRPIIWLYGSQKAADNAQLSISEKNAYNQSLKEIDRHYVEKQSHEVQGEAVRILLLENTLLDREFAAIK